MGNRTLGSKRLSTRFFAKPALPLARDLLGKILVHEHRGRRRAGRIVEVEAYVGEHDLACHASVGRTRRTEVLFGPPGRAYVYLIYGMYHCFNVVADQDGVAAAVLIRGLEPLGGIEEDVRTDGPGRLCRALNIGLEHNRLDLTGPRLYLLDGGAVADHQVASGPRIGVDYAGLWAEKPYRFWVQGSPGVSRTSQRAKSA